ncbi:lariat debranching enzyme [Ampelomyces quisqualis]|uniref:Lariat debranching enzyme n=1 Tax=Ampelomyces quisqualis TaxID=50730 RepID=A0A6A5Q839_AMPQU|nr:lariat debranching enzyme [Ampelomyces quisqualis]
MTSPMLLSEHGLRIAVEGCGHGVLHSIYASVAKACELKGWSGVDLLIIGGDFQAVRNASDLKAVSMPAKYYDMQDFHEYYSGVRTAPYLTTFIGGNHEASNYMWELYYGGWVAPNIYYMGAANVVRLGPLRIAGLSGIWKGYNYKKPHYERLPYNSDDVRSIYHVRELDVRKLLQIRTQVDIGLSHDWPRGMEWTGDHKQLFRWKPHFEQEAKDGTLGSVAATTVMERLRPPYWFSAHMHTKFAGLWNHADANAEANAGRAQPIDPSETTKNTEEIDLDVMDDAPAVAPKNDAEIDLDMDEDESGSAQGADADKPDTTSETKGTSAVPQDLRDMLPASFARSQFEPIPTLPFPTDITNKTTRFLALDKCLPKRSFLQLVGITPHNESEIKRPLQLEYDQEWLAITRVFAADLQLGDPNAKVPADKGDAFYRPLIEDEMRWVEENIMKADRMIIPEDFAQTAPVYEPASGIHVLASPNEYSNPHTQAFCNLLQIPNKFHASDEERAQLMQSGPRPEQQRSDHGGGRRRGGFRGGNGSRGGGRGQGRGRGGGRGRGRW